MTTYLLSLTASEQLASALADELSEGTILPADAAGAFDLGDGTWGMEAYFPEPPAPERLTDALTHALSHRDDISADDMLAALAGFSLRPLDGDDWSEIGLDAIPPIAAGRFRVFGEHNHPAADARRRFDLTIEASNAFGTGDHASTYLALSALDAVLKRGRPARVLDLGTGTGILALATAKVYPATRIVASDIEPIAVRMSEINRRGNQVAAPISIILATGLHHPVIRGAAPYDLVLANILPAPLTAMATAIIAAMAPRGRLIMAGLRRGEEARMIACYRARGLILARRLRAKEWTALVFLKP